MRELVGPTEPSCFDNPTGAPVFGAEIEPERYESVLDFGCGCGRLARQMIQQQPRPRTYVGIDLHKGMVRWNQQNLQPAAPGFEFHHHNVYEAGFNPDPNAPRMAEFPVDTSSVSLLIAWSVFTHLTQAQCEHYLREVARVLRPDGVMISTWFFFDKAAFPMMQDFQYALYINDINPTNAVIFDARWIMDLTTSLGLILRKAVPPNVRGFAYTLQFTPARAGVVGTVLPPDQAPFGRKPPPIGRANADRIGLETSGTVSE
jgi:SAM-dependent methyltransferase